MNTPPSTAQQSTTSPLEGIRVIELAGIGPGPHVGQVLADMGAEVVRVTRPGGPLAGAGDPPMIPDRGKKSVVLNLREAGAREVLLDMVRDADVLLEANRPGVAERLGVGPEACHAVNPRLVYGRMTGWGQTGPWAERAGHDINYISITGALHALGEVGRPPPPPLNFVGDYGGGSLFCVAGILAALLRAERTGLGDVVDAAIVDGAHSLMGIVHALAALRQWSPERQSNLIDGAAPFYRCYGCADGGFIAVGCIEPQFFAEMLDLLEIDPEGFGRQTDVKVWPAQHARLEALFATRDRDHWAELFEGSDACVTPVLTYREAADHPHNAARGALTREGSFTHPAPAPRFGSGEVRLDPSIAAPGSHTREVLEGLGYSEARIAELVAAGVVAAA